ncbi:hypothetical protein JKY72_06975 [Candidatus Gracilibacteria bacterium]|nr:hypothetical protein [Candidatus Gracilibacteria bacterium]
MEKKWPDRTEDESRDDREGHVHILRDPETGIASHDHDNNPIPPGHYLNDSARRRASINAIREPVQRVHRELGRFDRAEEARLIRLRAGEEEAIEFLKEVGGSRDDREGGVFIPRDEKGIAYYDHDGIPIDSNHPLNR